MVAHHLQIVRLVLRSLFEQLSRGQAQFKTHLGKAEAAARVLRRDLNCFAERRIRFDQSLFEVQGIAQTLQNASILRQALHKCLQQGNGKSCVALRHGLTAGVQAPGNKRGLRL